MKTEKKKAAFYALLAGSMWGTIGLFVNLLGRYGIGSLDLTVWRMFIAACTVGLFLLIFARDLFAVRLRDIPLFFVSGVFCLLIFNVSYSKSIEYSSMSAAAVMLYTSPVFVMAVSVAVFHEKLTARKLIAVGLAITGCAFVSGIMSGILSFPLRAYGWGFAAAGGYAMYSITAGVLLKRYDARTVLFYAFSFAALAGSLFADMGSVAEILLGSWQAAVLLFAAALICNVFSYLFYNMALKHMEASFVSVVASVEPAVASLIGAVALGEAMDIYGVAGVACIFGAIVVLNSGEGKN